jgi:NadR type nicotinamide-nucleotide adenylyltransferase
LSTLEKLKRIAIVGPECTGKSDLAKFLAAHFHTQWVPEFARTYIEALNRPYEEHDLVTIARGQLSLEDALAEKANRVLICDTNLIVIKIWSEFKYGRCAPEILEPLSLHQYDLHLLTYVDIPWEADPQREHPHLREELFDIYKKELEQLNVPFIEIRGERNQRRTTAIQAIEGIL